MKPRGGGQRGQTRRAGGNLVATPASESPSLPSLSLQLLELFHTGDCALHAVRGVHGMGNSSCEILACSPDEMGRVTGSRCVTGEAVCSLSSTSSPSSHVLPRCPLRLDY